MMKISRTVLSLAATALFVAVGCSEPATDTKTTTPTTTPGASTGAPSTTEPKGDTSTDLGAPEGSSTPKSGTDLAPAPGTDAK